MPLYHPQNQYRGVNAHFQSYCQAENDWESFHGQWIAMLAVHIHQLLPAGYTVRPEQSLQIREFHPDTGELIFSRPKPDLSLFDKLARPQGHFAFAPAPTLIMPLPDTLPNDPAAYLRAITIYESLHDKRLGMPVTQLEILSPTNKPPASGYPQYVYKRDRLLQAGLNLVEVDFLHETPSPLENIPHYPDQVPYATPYYIAISTPIPTLRDGDMALYTLEIDEPIPVVHIPLRSEDFIRVDFAQTYNQAYENLFSEVVDYTQLPPHFDRYTPADQAKIQAVMQRVQAAKP